MKRTVRRIATFLTVMLFVTTGCYGGVKTGEDKNKRYREGLRLTELGSYEAASQVFEGLGSFKQSDYLESYCNAAAIYDSGDYTTYQLSYSRITKIPDSYSGALENEISRLKADITKSYRNYLDEKIRQEEKERTKKLILTMISNNC